MYILQQSLTTFAAFFKTSLFVVWTFCIFPLAALTAETDPEAEKNRWVNDARAEWPLATSTLQMMAGRNSMVLQVGYLRSEWNSGSLIIICDGDKWSFDSLRILCLSKAWGEYIPFRPDVRTEEEEKNFMTVLRSIVQSLTVKLPSSSEAREIVGGVSTSGGCLVIELIGNGQFRQFAANRTEPQITKQLGPAIEVLDWWFRCYVSLMVGSIHSTPQWGSRDAPLLPVIPHIPDIWPPGKASEKPRK